MELEEKTLFIIDSIKVLQKPQIAVLHRVILNEFKLDGLRSQNSIHPDNSSHDIELPLDVYIAIGLLMSYAINILLLKLYFSEHLINYAIYKGIFMLLVVYCSTHGLVTWLAIAVILKCLNCLTLVTTVPPIDRLARKYAYKRMLVIGSDPSSKVKGVMVFYTGKKSQDLVIDKYYDMELNEWAKGDLFKGVVVPKNANAATGRPKLLAKKEDMSFGLD
ncbi:hypothetical protein VNO77_03431 [Canavalia gladiata]|uniref:Uncharacterized protein n=1 Tax=Canavalia gladiata TaxID=3824 RepID=A0AAN9MUP6_CANGL